MIHQMRYARVGLTESLLSALRNWQTQSLLGLCAIREKVRVVREELTVAAESGKCEESLHIPTVWVNIHAFVEYVTVTY